MVNGKRQIVLIVHNIRSAHNVGSLLRSADGFGVDKVYLTGYSPYPKEKADKRLPHVAENDEKQISKTSLGAEKNLDWEHVDDVSGVINHLRKSGYKIVALEQTPEARNLSKFHVDNSIALIIGNEVSGIDQQLLQNADIHLRIPMLGSKESFNVSVAAAVALYQLRWYNSDANARKNKNARSKN